MTTPLCTIDPECKSEALYSFVWPWGEAGTCCAVHTVHVNQKADALGRGPVQLMAIDPGRPQTISRDERARLRADIIVRDEDCQALKSQIVELHKSNDAMATEARRLRARTAHLEGVAKDAADDLEAAREERDEAVAALADVTTERDRLRVLVDVAAREAPERG